MKEHMFEGKSRNRSPPLPMAIISVLVGLAILSSLSALVSTANSAAAQKNNTAGETSNPSANATIAEAKQNATTSAHNATTEAGKAAASAGNAIANATTAAGGIIGNAVANATSSLNKSINVPSSITVTPGSVNPGDLVVIKGSGFRANNTITLTFDKSANATTATTDGLGAFNATMTTPRDAANGSHTITATDQDGKSATAIVTIVVAPPASATSPSSRSSPATG